jgi:hypothetical protein
VTTVDESKASIPDAFDDFVSSDKALESKRIVFLLERIDDGFATFVVSNFDIPFGRLIFCKSIGGEDDVFFDVEISDLSHRQLWFVRSLKCFTNAKAMFHTTGSPYDKPSVRIIAGGKTQDLGWVS